VLKHGRDSAHAGAFDIDWDFGSGRLRLPVLGDEDLADHDGTIGHLEVVDGELRYHGHRFPLAPGTADDLGRHGVDATAVHARQHYELVSWRRADADLNYRRFFAVSTLAAVRVEDPQVFADTHVEIGRWFDEGLVDGLRIDHPDGLREPGRYLDDLAERTGHPYVLVEKILEPGEQLSPEWATAGTTGYDALALIDRVLVDPRGEEPLTDLDTRLRGKALDWEQEVRDRKREVATGILRAETRRIVRELTGLDAAEEQLEEAVAELLACFPVYRSYLPEGREHLDTAARLAASRRPDLAPAIGAVVAALGDASTPAAARFQQTSGMVMAKGVEDCAFYRYSRLTSLNEVGGDPSWFALTVDDFHRRMAARQEHWPAAMTALSTHDTKRGEDVRARIAVLAELPEVWREALHGLLARAPMSDPAFGALLWQAIVGAWPTSPFGRPPADLRPRLQAYAEKAMREAGTGTTWTDPEPAYEKEVHGAVDAAFDDPGARAILADVLDRVAAPGWSNALVAKLLAATMPGVCDVYQGTELWEQSLVDPDNRRAVDFDRRQEVLRSLDGAPPPPRPTSISDSGATKLWVLSTALRLRRDQPGLFGGYTPLAAAGPAAAHVLAFDRGGAVTVGTRLPVGLARAGGWQRTTLPLPSGRWRDLLSPSDELFEGDAPVDRLLDRLPVALLTREG
jgi:(1->4)-alpha-D-glucan 1-alpha-D-glucosylmutase